MPTKQVLLIYLVLFYFVGITIVTIVGGHRIRIPYSEHPGEWIHWDRWQTVLILVFIDVRGRCWYKAQNRFLDRNTNYTRPISFLECEHVECLADFSLVIEWYFLILSFQCLFYSQFYFSCPPQRQKCPIRLGDPSGPFPRCCPTCDYSLLREWNVQTRNEANRGSRDNPLRC